MTRLPTSMELLDAWDELRDRTSPERAAALVALAEPALSHDVIGAMPLGRRDCHLLELRAALFGRDIAGLNQCPACAETVETSFSIDGLLGGLTTGEPGRTAECAHESWRVRFRAPTIADACALAVAGHSSARSLALHCIVEARENDEAVSADYAAEAMPDAAIAQIADGISTLDPAADLLLHVTCPACGHAWHASLDVTAFVWRELTAWARRTLADIASLARAYGWREPDILAMTARRRADYLEMLAV